MQLIIMDSRLTRCRTLQLTGGRLVAAALAASLVLMCVAALLYHLVFLKTSATASCGKTWMPWPASWVKCRRA